MSQSNPEVAGMASGGSQFAVGTSSLPSEAGITGGPAYVPSVYVGSENPNPRPQACVPRASTAELTPRDQCLLVRGSSNG